MLFPTVEYTLFFILVLLSSWYIFRGNTFKKVFLLLASYVFYGFWDWGYVPLLVVISWVGYAVARYVQYHSDTQIRKAALTIGVTICLLILAYYKYIGFFVLNLVNLLNWVGLPINVDFESPILPLGVSFFVFHAISLMGDAYRDKVGVKITLLDSLLYIAFFPQLIAGPILRASSFLPQLAKAPNPNQIRLNLALMLIVAGLFQKVIISNYLATWIVDDVFATPTLYGGMDILFAVYGYAAQIYCDFAGYTSMAAGCAMLLGYRFPKNFDAPYTATSPQAFWHRWHISLSTWLRDYLYIPLGGSKISVGRTYINLFITMLLGGLWHGASWTFVVWGVLHGSYLMLHRFWSQLPIDWIQRFRQSVIWQWIARILTFHAVCVGWVFFRATSFDNAFQIFQGIFKNGTTQLLTPMVVLLIMMGLFAQYRPRQWDKMLENKLASYSPVVLGLLLAGCVLVIEILAPTGVAPFIYFQF